MLTIMLATLMAMANPTIDGTDTDKNNKNGLSDRPLSRVEAEPPTHLSRMYNHPYTPTNRGKVWLTLGYGHVTSEFDDDGNRQNLGSIDLPPAVDIDATSTSIVMNVGGQYTFYRIGDMNLNAGINFAAAQHKELRDITVSGQVQEDNLSSGFKPQNLTIFGEIEQPSYSFRVGYIQDLGPELGDADVLNSDQQSAIQVGASTEGWAGPMRIFGNGDYFLTLPRDETTASGDRIDVGDVINLGAGTGYNWGSGEIGLALQYRINTEGNPAGVSRDFRTGYLLSAVPYVTYAPAGANYQVSVKGAVQREYHDYGYALIGRNDIAPRAGVTVGLTYGF